MTSITKRAGLASAVVVAFIFNSAVADSYTPPAGVPAPSFANNFVVIGDVGNSNDSRTGYGGVDYKYRVSATQITVGDWVAFLNVVDPNNTMGFDSIESVSGSSSCDNDFCFATYAHSGSSWSVLAFNNDGMSMSSSQTANLPIDWLSLNMVGRYMNWLATGDINQGAFTFSNTTSANATITSYDANYPGPRLPLEDELYKAMFWDQNQGSYNNYPTTNLSGSTPVIAAVDASGTHNSNAGGALIPGYFGTRHYAQVGQETGNPWGLYDATGNRHETTLNPSNTTTTILRGASAFDNPATADASLYTFRNDTLDAGKRYVSVGYRVWMGVSAPSGMYRIAKQVTGGTDTQQFTFNVDCTDNNFDKLGANAVKILAGATYESEAIPVGVSCTVTEVTPVAPSGFTYGTIQYSPSQTVTIADGTTQTITVTNPLQPTASPNVDLELTKVADKTNVNSGDVVRYLITVTNKGPEGATGVEVTDNLPSGVTYQATHYISQGTFAAGVWAIGALAKDVTATLEIDVTVD